MYRDLTTAHSSSLSNNGPVRRVPRVRFGPPSIHRHTPFIPALPSPVRVVFVSCQVSNSTASTIDHLAQSTPGIRPNRLFRYRHPKTAKERVERWPAITSGTGLSSYIRLDAQAFGLGDSVDKKRQSTGDRRIRHAPNLHAA